VTTARPETWRERRGMDMRTRAPVAAHPVPSPLLSDHCHHVHRAASSHRVQVHMISENHPFAKLLGYDATRKHQEFAIQSARVELEGDMKRAAEATRKDALEKKRLRECPMAEAGEIKAATAIQAVVRRFTGIVRTINRWGFRAPTPMVQRFNAMTGRWPGQPNRAVARATAGGWWASPTSPTRNPYPGGRQVVPRSGYRSYNPFF